MSDVSVGQSVDDAWRGLVSVRVRDESGTRVYKIGARDMKTIYDSIEREVLDAALFEIESDTYD